MKTCFEAEYQCVALNVSVEILIFSCGSRCRCHLIVSGVFVCVRAADVQTIVSLMGNNT